MLMSTHKTCIQITDLSYKLPQGRTLFKELSFGLGLQRTGFIGNNGIGKTTLCKIIANLLPPTTGKVHLNANISYLDQNPKIPANSTVADMLNASEKLRALNRIYSYQNTEEDLEVLGEDWNIKERLIKTLEHMGLTHLSFERKLSTLSGGELTRLRLAKALYEEVDYLILDEPTNNLDKSAREKLYQFIQYWKKGLLVISHDRTLLNLLDQIIELTPKGLSFYGGNYDYYKNKKEEEQNTIEAQYLQAKRELKQTDNEIKLRREKKHQHDKKAHKKSVKAGISKLERNGAKEKASKTQGKIKIQAERQLSEAQTRKDKAWKKVEIVENIEPNLDHTKIPKGKEILRIKELSFSYPNRFSLLQSVNLSLVGPERLAIIGPNGSGKSTLIQLILNKLTPCYGEIKLGTEKIAYLDQNVENLDHNKSLYENFILHNSTYSENDTRYILAKFLFRGNEAFKKIINLSGGEKIRAGLACALMSETPPQLIILDEPTNHLDISSIEKIEAMLKNYQGAIIVTSHDESFLKNISINKYYILTQKDRHI